MSDSPYDPAEYVRLLNVARDALTTARLYGESHGRENWRPAFSDLILLDSLLDQPEGEDWWPVGGGESAMVALIEGRQAVEIPEGYWEYHESDTQEALGKVGRLATTDDEVCGGCGKRWPEGTGEVIECENDGCPGTCPACQNDPCPHHEGASA